MADRRLHEGSYLLPLSWTDAHFRQFLAMKRRNAAEIARYERRERNKPIFDLIHAGILGYRKHRHGATPILSKWFPYESRDIDAILFYANNPNNTFQRLFTVGANEDRDKGGLRPIRRAGLRPGERPSVWQMLIEGAKGSADAGADSNLSEDERARLRADFLDDLHRRFLADGVKRAARNLVPLERREGTEKAVAALQRGLNHLAKRDQAGRLPAWATAFAPKPAAAGAAVLPRTGPPPLPALNPLRVDGVLGPKTFRGLIEATLKAGPAMIGETVGRERFRAFTKQARRDGSTRGLGAAVAGAFGPLLEPVEGAASAEPDAPRGNAAGAALQRTLNTIDGFTGGSGRLLTEDGIAGPKTERAFRDTIDFANDEDLADEFAWNHGFF